MKKLRKLLLFVCVLTCVFSLTACGKGNKEKASFEYEESELVSCVTTNTETAGGWDDATLKSAIESYDDTDETQANLKKGLEQFESAKKEAGEFVGFYLDADGNAKYKLTQNSDTVTVKLNAKFKKRDVKVTYVFGLIDKTVSITSMTYEPKYSLGETMKKAALNTLMGMGTVIVVLFFLSILISQFTHVKKLENFMQKMSENRKAKKENKTKNESSNDVVEQIVEKEKADQTDDTELVAVITAAIAASEHTSTDGFVVRSIKRVSNRNWK